MYEALSYLSITATVKSKEPMFLQDVVYEVLSYRALRLLLLVYEVSSY